MREFYFARSFSQTIGRRLAARNLADEKTSRKPALRGIFTPFYAFVLLADHTPWAINAVVAAPAQSLFAAGFAGLGCGIVAN